jgi:glycosyltransferase involved in cell wall biosynthesis
MIELTVGKKSLRRNMAKIVYVVHRYAPYPGGSENYVRDMAEETLRRGHEVIVFAGEHKGDHNGVRVTSDPAVFNEKIDLVVVHGGDVGWQDNVLAQCQKIQAPVLFMLIIPSESQLYQFARQHVAYIGCSTRDDWNYVTTHGVRDKAVRVRHGIDPKISIGLKGFREKYGIKTPYMFLSCGGYWHNKKMAELVQLFKQVQRTDVTLVTTGYDNRFGIMPQDSEYVKNLLLDNRDDVMSAIRETDLYVMHSDREGFGLVLLESMLNKTPWAARDIAGANLMREFGFTYTKDEELFEYMRNFKHVSQHAVEDAYEYVTMNHLIGNTVDDILKLI